MAKLKSEPKKAAKGGKNTSKMKTTVGIKTAVKNLAKALVKKASLNTPKGLLKEYELRVGDIVPAI